jgi:hypothetical protein
VRCMLQRLSVLSLCVYDHGPAALTCFVRIKLRDRFKNNNQSCKSLLIHSHVWTVSVFLRPYMFFTVRHRCFSCFPTC